MMTKPLCASAVFVLLQWSVSAYAAPASAPAAPPTNTPAAASAPAPAPAPTTTANRHRCYVQLGAFQNQQWAEQQVAEVALLGIKEQSLNNNYSFLSPTPDSLQVFNHYENVPFESLEEDDILKP